MRCPATSTFPAVEAFARSGRAETRLWLTPSDTFKRSLTPAQRRTLAPLRLRVMRLEAPDGTVSVLLTNLVDLRRFPRAAIIALSWRRWAVETFYQDGKTPLGLDEYRMRNAEAIQKHWCLVFVAYSFLHLDCLPLSPTKGNLPIKTIGEACRQQAQALMQAVIFYAHERLQLGQKAQDIFGYLFAKQQPVLAR